MLALFYDSSVTFGPSVGVGYQVTVGTNSTILVDHNATGTGQTLSLGNVAIGANTLTFLNGDNYNLSLGTVSASAGPTFANNMTTSSTSGGSAALRRPGGHGLRHGHFQRHELLRGHHRRGHQPELDQNPGGDPVRPGHARAHGLRQFHGATTITPARSSPPTTPRWPTAAG